MGEIYFVTNNQYKAEEISDLGINFDININTVEKKIEELQVQELEKLVRDKTLQAFKYFGHPILIEHACLHINSLDGMPGTLTQIFWDNLKEKICTITHLLGDDSAKVSSTFGFCDGYKIYIESAYKLGKIVERPRGTREFQWDTIFIPEGSTKTYAEMSIREKNSISQRKDAFEKIIDIIKGIKIGEKN